MGALRPGAPAPRVPPPGGPDRTRVGGRRGLGARRGWYERGLEVDDLSEELYQHLIAGYQALGRQADAVRAYERCRRRLRRRPGGHALSGDRASASKSPWGARGTPPGPGLSTSSKHGSRVRHRRRTGVGGHVRIRASREHHASRSPSSPGRSSASGNVFRSRTASPARIRRGGRACVRAAACLRPFGRTSRSAPPGNGRACPPAPRARGRSGGSARGAPAGSRAPCTAPRSGRGASLLGHPPSPPNGGTAGRTGARSRPQGASPRRSGKTRRPARRPGRT